MLYKSKKFSRSFRRPQRPRRDRRAGAAIVEFAVCLPLIILIVFGSIEAASMLFLKQAMVQGAYEGVKTAIKPDSTNAEVTAAIDQMLAGRNLTGVQILIEPSSIDGIDPGELVRITVSAPGEVNSLLPFGLFDNQSVSADAAMIKE